MKPGCYCLWWRTRTLQLSGPEAVLCCSCHLKTQQLGVLKYSLHFLGCRVCWVEAALAGTTQKERAGSVHENVTAVMGYQSKGSSGLSAGVRAQNRRGDISAVCGLGTCWTRGGVFVLGSLCWSFHKSAHSIWKKNFRKTMLAFFSSAASLLVF